MSDQVRIGPNLALDGCRPLLNRSALFGPDNMRMTLDAEGNLVATPYVSKGDEAAFTANGTFTPAMSVENLLIASMTADGSLSAELSTSWTPDEITTFAWYDANDSGTITLSGSDVTQWNDKSGSGYHLNTYTNAPTYQATGWDGSMAGIDFNGTTEWIEHGSTVSLADGMTLAMIYDDDVTQGRLFGVRYTSSNKSSFGADTGSNALGYDGAASIGSISPTTGKHFRVSTKNATANGVTDWIDGVQNINDTPSIVDSVNVYINVGAANTSNDQRFNGRIVECIIIEGVVDTDTREILEGYLAWKWGIESLLPVDHTYKLEAPQGA